MPTDADIIEFCDGCGCALGVAAPYAGAWVSLAKCATCDRRYYVSDNPQISGDWVSGPKAERGFSPFEHLAMQQPEAVERLVEAIDAALQSTDERRTHTRVQTALKLLVAPLDDHLRPRGPTQHAASMDISVGGVSFLVRKLYTTRYWLVDFGPTAGPGQQSIIEVARTKLNDQETGVVAGPFISQFVAPATSCRVIYANRRA